MNVELPPVVTTAAFRREAIARGHRELAAVKESRLLMATIRVRTQLYHRPGLDWVMYRRDFRFARELTLLERLQMAWKGRP